MARYGVTVYLCTVFFVEAESPAETERIALERIKENEWWIVHRGDLQASAEVVSARRPTAKAYAQLDA